MNVCNKIGRILVFALPFLFAVSSLSLNRAEAYVLPAQQLLHFVAAHFAAFETLAVTHRVERESEEGTQSFEETLIMKSPDLLHVVPAEEGGNQGRAIDRSYRTLFLANSQDRLRDLLDRAGVNVERVSYTRVGGSVAYLIGERGAFRPSLAVEKARFLPLVFSYPSRFTIDTEFIRVTFGDFRQVDRGWYPFEILCSSDAGWSERYNILSIQVNVPYQPSLFLPSQTEFRPAESSYKDERIDGVIRSFEQKVIR